MGYMMTLDLGSVYEPDKKNNSSVDERYLFELKLGPTDCTILSNISSKIYLNSRARV